MQMGLATSDNNTKTRVSNFSTKPDKIRPTRNKVQTPNVGYLASDKSIIIPTQQRLAIGNGLREVSPAEMLLEIVYFG